MTDFCAVLQVTCKYMLQRICGLDVYKDTRISTRKTEPHSMAPPTDYSKSDVCNIMKLKWMSFMRCKLAGTRGRKLPSDVPPGHLAVTVGDAGRRFVIKADYLNQPAFRQLLDKTYEDYGPNKDGPLAIPCDECLFRDIIHSFNGGSDVCQLT
ncbi:auxin-induced protein 15A-like [Herrania umbratica]|uniref:Auxin-induced protein 15A-like n=1 Tax=Herrania umbratica TaxID=108875 RepID=A0A6J1AQN9_9ROSI|nr:auxin-induced protein 15A-like [Herrania umbratica]